MSNVMPKKTSLSNLILYLAVFGLFITAIVVSFVNQRSEGIVGVILMVVGVGAIWFSRALTEAQQELAERPYIPNNWRDIRPLTFVLWGTGVFIVGIANVFVW